MKKLVLSLLIGASVLALGACTKKQDDATYAPAAQQQGSADAAVSSAQRK